MGSKIAFFALAFAAGVAAQETVASHTAPAQPEPGSIYYSDSGVSAPVLIPRKRKFASAHGCEKKDGMPVLGAVVGIDGVPGQISVLRQAGSDLDQAAVAYLESERFKPGSFNGVPVPVAVEVELDIEACVQSPAKDRGAVSVMIVSRPDESLELLPRPADTAGPLQSPSPAQTTVAVYKVGGGVSAPVLLNHVNPSYTEDARRNRIQGDCVIGLIADANGIPQNVHLVRSLQPDLDRNAILAVMKYRFKPASKNGVPVAVSLFVEVAFRLY
jgi:TonB family protein